MMIDFGKLFPESSYKCILSGSARVCPALFTSNGSDCLWMIIVLDGEKGLQQFFHLHLWNLLHAFIVHLFFIFPYI